MPRAAEYDLTTGLPWVTCAGHTQRQPPWEPAPRRPPAVPLLSRSHSPASHADTSPNPAQLRSACSASCALPQPPSLPPRRDVTSRFEPHRTAPNSADGHTGIHMRMFGATGRRKVAGKAQLDGTVRGTGGGRGSHLCRSGHQNVRANVDYPDSRS